MSEGRDSTRALHWLGTAAVDGARVGPFTLSSTAVGAKPGEPSFDVYLDGFDAPLASGVSPADADALTRRFMSSIADWDAKLRVVQHSSFPPPASARRSSSQRSSSRRSSKRSRSNAGRRLPRKTIVLLFVGVVAALSGVAYFWLRESSGYDGAAADSGLSTRSGASR